VIREESQSMNGFSTSDEVFRSAVAAMDAGDLPALDRLLAAHPSLPCERLAAPGAWLRDRIGAAADTFFNRPYLLWFVAEDPVRNGTLPPNIAELAQAIVHAARQACRATLSEQVDYALRLVAWSWIARECGVQIPLIDVLIDAGATLSGTPDDALVNNNVAAAEYLIRRGAPLSLATAACLGRWSDLTDLAATAPRRQQQLALVLAALRGKDEAVRRLIEAGADVNAVSSDLYPHATPLHHAVHSGSLASVRMLVEAGARLDARDTVHGGTPLGWAEYSGDTPPYREIAAYLRARNPGP
jgi:peptide-methionine (S)-S-oxide reductase